MNKFKSLLFLLIPVLLLAGDIVSFSIVTDKNRVNEGGVATVQATLITNKMVKVDIPQFPESESYAVAGSNSRVSNSSSIQIVNGRRTSERRVETTFYYKVMFPKEGKVTLPALTVTVNGETASTKSLAYMVGGNMEKESPVSVSFIRKKSTVYVNEQLPLKVRILVKIGSDATLTNAGFQDLVEVVKKGVEEKFSMTITDEVKQSREVINGINYEVVDLDLSLTAIDTGTVVIKPTPFSYVERKKLQSRDNFGFASSFFSSTHNVDAATATPRLTLKVVPPPPAPKGYTGIVGKVRLRGSATPKSVAVGEGITLKYVLSGRMKSAAIGEITMPELPDFEQFTPEKRTIADSTGGRISTKKEYSYMLIPRSAGDFTIPALEVIWFNPATGKYQREKAGPYKVTVTPSDKPVNASKRYLTKEQIATVGSDIRYIKIEEPAKSEIIKPYQNTVFIILLPLPWLLLLLMILYKLSVKLIPTNAERSLRKGALGRAFRELDRIQKGKSKGSPAAVVEKYLLQKYKISAPSMRRDELRTALIKNGADENAASAVITFLDEVEMNRYSGGDSKELLVGEAKKTLKQITREVN